MAALPARRQNFTEKNEIAALWCPAQRKARHFAWDGAIRDLSAIVSDHAGEFLLPEPLEKLRKADRSRSPKVAGEPRVGPCVGSVGKFVCIGLNYSDHAKEAGMPVPVEPLVFMKPTSSILSKFMSLQTGDVISTGTPPGVGFGLKPLVYLRAPRTAKPACSS